MSYGILSDIHFHRWSAFAHTIDDGFNSRLHNQLCAFEFACAEMFKRRALTCFITGDLFHVRGSVAPSVLVPVLDAFNGWSKKINFVIIPGNHDLEAKEASRHTSAVTALEPYAKVINSPDEMELDGKKFLLVPWIENIADLKNELSVRDNSNIDVVMLHAPIDGVLPGLPDHGLTAEWLEQTFPKATIFSGHYHHHKKLGERTYSVGALTHQTWSDVGSRAGFVIVQDDKVEQFETHAPKFADFSAVASVSGNYIRLTVTSSDPEKIAGVRDKLTKMGAAGVLVRSLPAPTTTREASVVKAAAVSLEESVNKFVESKGFEYPAETGVLCQKLLANVINPN